MKDHKEATNDKIASSIKTYLSGAPSRLVEKKNNVKYKMLLYLHLLCIIEPNC